MDNYREKIIRIVERELLNFLKALTVIKTIIFNNCLDFAERLIALSFHYLRKWLILLRESDLHLTLGKDVA